MSSYTKMKKIFLRGLLWLYLFGFGYMALTLEPGFLDFDNLPDTNFTCVGKVIGGYYADLETNCQMFHVCTIGQLDEPMDIRFLCLNGTVFDQETRVCERVDEVDCSKSEQFYSLNLELYGNSQPTNLEENSETEQPLIIKSTLPTTTTTTSTEATRKTTRPSYYTSSSSNPAKSSTTQVLNHHFPVVSPNSADIRFNPEEINISLKLGSPPFIRTKPSFHGPSASYSDKTPGYSDKPGGYSDRSPGYSDQKVVVTTHRGAFDNNSDKRKEGDGITQVQAPSVQKTVANVHGFGNRPTPSDINYEFSYTDSSELEGYQTENYQFQKEFRPSQQYSGPLHNPITPQYQATTFRTLTTQTANNYQQQKSSTTNRNIYIHSLKPPAPNQQNHYVHHQTEKAPHRIQLPLPFLPTLPPLTFSSPAPFTLHHHIDAKRYTKEHVSPPRIIISASASVSDASGRRLNYSLGTIGAAQILDDAPNSYDDYKETDVALDPFYHDVPKLKHSTKRKRSTDNKQPLPKRESSKRKKRDAEEPVKHSAIIKSDQDAVNVLKFLFDWYRNEKTNPASSTTTPPPESTPLAATEVQAINEELTSPKPVETKIEISTGASEQDPLGISFKKSDLFNKKSKFSIVGDDKYAVTHEEVKKVNQVQQNLSFSDTREAPKYSFLDDYVDDNYEPETYKSKYGFEDDHDRFKYSSFLDDMDTYEDKDPDEDKYFSDDKDDYYEKDLKSESKNRSMPKDYVDDNIEPLYYKDRYSDSENKNKIVEHRSSSQQNHLTTPLHNEESIPTTTEVLVLTSIQNENNRNYDSPYQLENESIKKETHTSTENQPEQTSIYEKEYTSKLLENNESFTDADNSQLQSKHKEYHEVRPLTTEKEPTQTHAYRQKHRSTPPSQLERDKKDDVESTTKKELEEETFYTNIKEETTTQTEPKRFYIKKPRQQHSGQGLKLNVEDITTEEVKEATTTKQQKQKRRKTTHRRKQKGLKQNVQNSIKEDSNNEEHQQINNQLKVEEPTTQVEENKPLSQAHLESIEIEDLVEATTKETNVIEDDVIRTEQIKPVTSTTEMYQELLHKINHHDQNSSQTTVKQNDENQFSSTELIETSEINITQESNTENASANNLEDITKSHTGNMKIKQNSTEISSPQGTSEKYETSSVNSRQENTTVVTDVSRSEPEINVVISKAFKTNKTRLRTNGRGRRKFKDPEVSVKNSLIEKLIEKPYRAKDDYDYLKTVSNVQPSTEKDSNETNDTISSHTEHGAVVKPNDLLLPSTSSTAQPKSVKRRGRHRLKVETTSVRNVRRRRPTQNSIHADNHPQAAETELSTLNNTDKVSSTTDDINSHIDISTEQSAVHYTNFQYNSSKEPLSEILQTTTLSSEAIREQKVGLVPLSHQVPHTEEPTTIPVVDTTQTTPITTVIEKENLGTTNHPITQPTVVEKSQSSIITTSTASPEPFTQMDKIEEIYATSFVPTEKIHITKKKELKMTEEEAIPTTSVFYTEPVETTNEPTTVWIPLSHKENDNIVSHSFNIAYSTTHLPTTLQEPASTTLKTYYPSTILETTTEEMSTNLDVKTTTESLYQEITKLYSVGDETQAPKNVWATENLQKLIEEIESTTRSVAADPVAKVLSEHRGRKHMRVRGHQTTTETTTDTVTESTFRDGILTTNDIKEENRSYLRNNIQTSKENHNIPEQTSAETRGETVAPIYHHIKELESTTLSYDLITTLPPETTEPHTTIQASQTTEPPTTTTSTRPPRARGRPTRRRQSDNHTQRSGYRHRFSTDEVTRRPESRKQTIEEEIIDTIARRSKQLTTEPTKVKKLKQIHTNVPLRKSVIPTQSEKIDESPLTTPLSRKTTVRKYYFFNCFNKEVNKFYPDPRDCRLFHYCTQGYTKNQLLDMKFVCDFNTFFDDENLVCTKKKPKRCL